MAYTEKYKDVRYRSKSRAVSPLHAWTSILLLFICSVLAALSFLQWKKLTKTQGLLESSRENIQIQQSELDVLRTINPYQYAFEQIIPRAVNEGDIFPGWVTRVFPAPRKPGQALTSMDVGAFILDQKKFDLAVHRSYGLETKENVLYRMNGLLPSKKRGRYQIGIEFTYDSEANDANNQSISMHSCFARLDVNAKRVIDTEIRFATNTSIEKLITGDVFVIVGVHPITANIYCDDEGGLKAKSIQISMRFREPGEVFLQQNRNSVFHIYRPNDA